MIAKSQGPAKSGVEELATTLGLTQKKLARLVGSAEQSYDRYALRSKKRRPRWIEAPKPLLKRTQRRLLEKWLYEVPPHEAAHGFFPGRSILTNARAHSGKGWVLSLDLKDFFPSTKREMVEVVLKRLYPFDGQARKIVLHLTCRRGALPQGAPTSPHLANLTFMEGDKSLHALAESHGLAYTRYADDMTFSGESLPEDLEARVEEIATQNGYRLAKRKTKRMGRHQCQKVTGLVVNEGLRLPRAQRRKLRAIRYEMESEGLEVALARSGFGSVSELQGNLAFEHMVNLAE